MDNKLIDKLKSVLGMPVQNEQAPATEPALENEVELVEVEVKAADANPAPAPVAETPADAADEAKKMDELTAAVADLTNRVANLEAQLTGTQNQNTQLKSQLEETKQIVELIAQQPSSLPPTRTESQFSKQSKNINTQSKEQRIKNMLKMIEA